MSISRNEPSETPADVVPRAASLLDRLTGIVLLVVMLAIGWMISVSLKADFARLASTETEVIAVTGLLTAALALVTVVALLHTRK